MRSRTRRWVFFYGPVLVLLTGIVYWGMSQWLHLNLVSDSKKAMLKIVTIQPEELKPQSTVANALKIDVEVTKISNEEIVFHVTMESYENSEAIAADPMETTILALQNETPYKPESWKNIRSTDYQREGYLTFKINQKPEVIRLSIFELEERIFEWTVSE
ncbi:hypothetical protein EBR96_03580 [bacterium]|nr:hypothetical protein [bacterium]